jgi:hypothetical protein
MMFIRTKAERWAYLAFVSCIIVAENRKLWGTTGHIDFAVLLCNKNLPGYDDDVEWRHF